VVRLYALDATDHPIGYGFDRVRGNRTSGARLADPLNQLVAIKGLPAAVMFDDRGIDQRGTFVGCESPLASFAFAPATDVAIAFAGIHDA
jgi:hypothetical protein